MPTLTVKAQNNYAKKSLGLQIPPVGYNLPPPKKRKYSLEFLNTSDQAAGNDGSILLFDFFMLF